MNELMRRIGSIVLLAAAACSVMAAQGNAEIASGAETNGKIASEENYVFPSFEAAVKKTGVRNYATKDEYDAAVADKNFRFSKLRYYSDGLKVMAYLYRPEHPASKLPVIIFNRGSFVRGDIAPELISMFHRLAVEGFAVVAPMYRGSEGGEGRDEMGGGDVDDLMNVLPLIRSLDYTDPANLFMYGESRGGVMTYLAARRKFPVNAAAVFGAITDMGEYVRANTATLPPKALEQIWDGYEANNDAILRARSAITWADELNVPLLIMQGSNDPQVSPAQSLALAGKLQSLGKPYQLIIYSGDNHILSHNRLDRDRETIAWFRQHLKKTIEN